MGISGTYLGAAYENMPYLCDKENERSNVLHYLIRVVPPEFRSLVGIGVSAFLYHRKHFLF